MVACQGAKGSVKVITTVCGSGAVTDSTLIVRICSRDGILGADCHLPGKNEIIGSQGSIVRPLEVLTQVHGDHASIRADPAIFHAGDLGHQHRERLIIYIVFPRPMFEHLPGCPGKPHAGIQRAEAVEFLWIGQGDHFGNCLSPAATGQEHARYDQHGQNRSKYFFHEPPPLRLDQDGWI